MISRPSEHQATFVSSEVKININGKGKTILVDNSFLFISSAWPQEPIICQFWKIITYIGVYGVYIRHFLTLASQLLPGMNLGKLFYRISRRSLFI